MADPADMLKMSKEQAEEQLDEDEFEQWQQLQGAKEDIDSYKEDAEAGLGTLISNAKDDMKETVEVFGIEIIVDCSLNEEQYEILQEMKQYQGMSEDEIEKLDEIIEKATEFLGVTTDNSEEEWKEVLDETGYTTFNQILAAVIQPIIDRKEEIEKFR